MNKTGKVILAVGALFSAVGVLRSEMNSRKKIADLERHVTDLRALNEAIILFQDDWNEELEERFEEVVDEIATVYRHMEVLADVRMYGR